MLRHRSTCPAVELLVGSPEWTTDSLGSRMDLLLLPWSDDLLSSGDCDKTLKSQVAIVPSAAALTIKGSVLDPTSMSVIGAL
mmetsp:Transcript_41938/g.83407  ORF Transcript_41938/g.83407 Transcript_41938/m.83407 type:complete len:82 (+) Transcript_41938:123-368(+)